MYDEMIEKYEECVESLNEAIVNFKEMARLLRQNGLNREAGYLEGYATNYMTGFEDDALQQVYDAIEDCIDED